MYTLYAVLVQACLDGAREGHGLGTRVGLEDTPALPDGAVADDSAALVLAACAIIENAAPQ